MLNKPLYILSQDLSKAFDSVDTRMLKLALQRIKLPGTAINLILDLSSDRTNRVFTQHGLTDPYDIKVGIDQGETISPLLWVIYIDLSSIKTHQPHTKWKFTNIIVFPSHLLSIFLKKSSL